MIVNLTSFEIYFIYLGDLLPQTTFHFLPDLTSFLSVFDQGMGQRKQRERDKKD